MRDRLLFPRLYKNNTNVPIEGYDSGQIVAWIGLNGAIGADCAKENYKPLCTFICRRIWHDINVLSMHNVRECATNVFQSAHNTLGLTHYRGHHP